MGVVGFAETWLYENGVLCYIHGRQLRILDLHRSSAREIVVDTRRLLDQAIEEPRTNCRYRLKLLYFADDIISGLYTHTRNGEVSCSHWLVVFNPRAGQIITTLPLESTAEIFVRNNHQFLYYGTNSEVGRDGYNRWVIHGFDLAARLWFDHPLEYPAVIGSEIGSTVCFEIFDGYFYGVSNQTCLEVEEIDWVSYYTCFRFPLGRHGFRGLESPPRQQFWRRNQTEGPIDDRWTFLRMFKDETTGQLKIVESRKEWLSGRISARRTYYTTAISFENPTQDSREGPSSAPVDSSLFMDGKIEPEGGCSTEILRDPHTVHPGDDNSTLTFTLSKCPLRSYYPSSQAFVDLVDDNPSFDPSTQRICLRGGSRRLLTPGELDQQKKVPITKQARDQDTLEQQIESLYTSETGVFWPPAEDPLAPDAALANLYAVLNPPGHAGKPHGSWDERSLVYATGDTNGGLKALVFVSWDPSIYLAHTPQYPGRLSMFTDSSGTLTPTPGEETNGKRRGITPCPGGSLASDGSSEASRTTTTHSAVWRTVKSAAYLDIARGYHFAC